MIHFIIADEDGTCRKFLHASDTMCITVRPTYEQEGLYTQSWYKDKEEAEKAAARLNEKVEHMGRNVSDFHDCLTVEFNDFPFNIVNEALKGFVYCVPHIIY